jgi:hypothetical protein
MVLGGNKSESDRTLEQLVARQEAINKRVERLESLEFRHWNDGRGCVMFVDYDFETGGATAMVEVNPDQAENGDFLGTQATIFWKGACSDEAAMVNLHMRIQNDATNNYYYSYKYSRGGALSQFGLGAQTELVVGRLPGNTGISAHGHITVPIYSPNARHMAFGDWTAYDITQAANSRQEKGEWGGLKNQVLEASRFDFFPAAGNFVGFQVYLYVWCPQLTPGGVPDD